MDKKEEGYTQAVEAIKKCCSPNGMFASGTRQGYTSVWSRDSMISLLGGSLAKDELIKTTFRKTLDTLSKYQSELGQIANCVDMFDSRRKKQVTFATIDSSLWYLIGEQIYAKRYGDRSLLKKHKRNIEKAILWLRYQDAGEEKLPEQQPTSDWQDAFPHKYGHTLNTQAMYYWVLSKYGMKKQAEEVKRIVNGEQRKDLNFWNRSYYLPWIWKDHGGYQEKEFWFDSLGNMLAIVFGLASEERGKKIIKHIEKNKINKPYPVKVIYPPIKDGDKEWKPYFKMCDARLPLQYLNGGIWPFVGGFYVAALVKLKMFKKAQQELDKLAQANFVGKKIEWEFNEWLDGRTGKPKGGVYQAWSIGMYMFAYECVRRKKVLI